MKRLAFWLIFSFNISYAVMIPNHKNSELRLGFGVDPVTEELKEQCITFESNKYVPEDQFKEFTSYQEIPSRSLGLNVELVTSYNEVDKYTNKSISADVKYAIYSGSFKYDKESRFSLESDRAMVGIEASADYGRWYLNNVKLKPQYEEMYQKDPEKFFSKCGYEYISGFTAGQGLRILLASEKESVYSYEKISSSMRASASGSAFSASLNASFLNVAESLSKLGTLTVSLFAYGGNQFTEVSSLIKTNDDLLKFRDNISGIAQSMDANKAVRTNWLTQAYPVGYSEESRILRDQKRRTLHHLFQTHRKLSDSRDRLYRIVTRGWEFTLDLYCNIQENNECTRYVAEMDKKLVDLNRSIGIIENYYLKCTKAQKAIDCQLPTTQEVNEHSLTTLKWPSRFKYELYRETIKDLITEN